VIVRQRRPKALVDHLNEAIPCRLAAVELQPVIPQPGVIEQIERGVGHLVVLQHTTEAEIAVAMIEPRKWVALPVEHWELPLVGGGHKIVPSVVFIGLGSRGTPESARVFSTCARASWRAAC
jgi:hypothetical protein